MKAGDDSGLRKDEDMAVERLEQPHMIVLTKESGESFVQL